MVALDLVLVPPGGGAPIFSGATIDSPETVTIANPVPGTWTLYVDGFTVEGTREIGPAVLAMLVLLALPLLEPRRWRWGIAFGGVAAVLALLVGCALHTEGGWDYLICRYAPAGNVVGQPVY